MLTVFVVSGKGTERGNKKTNIANKTAFRYCRAVFYQGEKVWNFFFFFGSHFAGGICNMADFLKLMTSDHQQKFFFKVKWVNIYDHLYSSRNASENSLRVVFQNSRCLSGHLCFHVFFNTAHIFKVEI